MSSTQSWIYKHLDENGFITNDFTKGVEEFIESALSKPRLLSNGKLKCPCCKYNNLKFEKVQTVCCHLCQHGFTNGYFEWTHHGEEHGSQMPSASSDVLQIDNTNSYKEMIIDAIGPTCFEEMDEGRDEFRVESEPVNPKDSRFYELLRDADELLRNGCKKHTKLSDVAQYLKIKSKFNLSQRCYDCMISTAKDMIPDDEKLASNFYMAKKQIRELGLDYRKIHACIKNCMLYYKEHANKKSCDTCNHPCFKPRNRKGKEVHFKVLRYFPLTPRLQRLFMLEKIVEYMKWHVHNRSQSGFMTHLADGEAWNHFDRTDSSFSADP